MSSPRFSVTCPTDILERWTLDDVQEAHDILDMYDELEALAASRSAG